MKIARTSNAVRNILYGTIVKIYQLLMPFIMKWLMIRYLSAEYLGLSGLFVSILDVLNLAELGVGTAMVYAMYSPIAENDNHKLSALLKLYQRYYRIIGIIVGCIGIAILPLIPKLVKGSVPADINVYYLYLLNLSATVISYWLYAYKNSLLQAFQRNDIASKVLIITDTFKYLFQFYSIVFLRNFYFYTLGLLLGQILTNIITGLWVDKMYPNIRAKGKLDDSSVQIIKKSIKDIFTSKLGTVIVNSADTIVISSFLGLKMLAIYQNYYSIMIAVFAFVMIALNSIVGGIGNSLVTESTEKNYTDFKGLSFAVHLICGICSCCFINIYQPFMKMWMGETMLLPDACVYLFGIYFYFYTITNYWCVYKNASGFWHEDRFRPLIGALLNLMLNLAFVGKFGIYAIILSTLISYILVMMPWLVHNIFKFVFHVPIKEYMLHCILYCAIGVIGIIIATVICRWINLEGIPGLILRLIVSAVSEVACFYLAARRKREFKYVVGLAKKVLRWRA